MCRSLPPGSIHCTFHASGHHYTWKKVTTTVHNIIVGKLWIDQVSRASALLKARRALCPPARPSGCAPGPWLPFRVLFHRSSSSQAEPHSQTVAVLCHRLSSVNDKVPMFTGDCSPRTVRRQEGSKQVRSMAPTLCPLLAHHASLAGWSLGSLGYQVRRGIVPQELFLSLET